MVAVFNKELLSWYLITLKLKETVEAGIPKQDQQGEEEEEHENEDVEKSSIPSDPEWVISIRQKVEEAGKDEVGTSWAKLCIYRVPKCLREGDDKAYVPQVVSLGPYHHAKRRLREMDSHKWRSLHQILKRSNQDVKLYLNAIQELEDKARACYEGTIPLSSNEFVETMVLDSCFVLELFRGAAAEGFKELGYSRNDPVFAMRGLMHSVQRDMIMLENQIPLFVLDRLLNLQIGDDRQMGLVSRLALRFFDPLMPTDEPLRKRDRNRIESLSSSDHTTFDPLTEQGGLHCLDVFRRSLLRCETTKYSKSLSYYFRRVADKRRQQLIHCVMELRESGIKFKKKKTDRFWDIKFHNGVLEIPRLLIHDGTKSLFLNLIAFEQCHLDCSNDITSFVIFMDNLINSSEDVGYLHYCGIIEHWLGSDDEVADLFNRLCQEVVFDINDSYLSKLSEEVNRYYNHRWNAWRASLKHNYFGNPWAIISLIAAIFLIALTLTQTFYGVYGYYRPNS
ncbi:UPF0481 protein At3g47200-like isoform X2 [Tasmannia lanceolata]|uniref:UPF0481 protein At3g47200-like isoform X2 n=1 Tax=Tasmannia lanceolata TaxID=3420 RepID=UPI0040630E5C